MKPIGQIGKKGIAMPLILLIAGLALVAGYAASKAGMFGGDTDSSLTVQKGDTTVILPDAGKAVAQKELTSCDGIASVNALYNDINFYKKGTDPAGNMTIYEADGKEFLTLVLDDATATTIPVLSEFKALAGNERGTPNANYFATPLEFSTACNDLPIQAKVVPSSAPTISFVNDDGITKNSDSNHELIGANSTYTPTAVIKAQSETCAARYGAIVAFEYDATYTNNVDSSHLDNAKSSFLVAHYTNWTLNQGAWDQYKIMLWNGTVMDIDGDGVNDAGALCDGKKIEIPFDVETTGTAAGEDNGTIVMHWYPLNYDLDSDDLTLIKDIYDEDNHLITEAETAGIWYTA